MTKAANRVRVAQRAIRMHKALRDASSGQVHVKRVATDSYRLLRPAGAIHEAFELTNVAGNVLQLRNHSLAHVVVGVDDPDPSIAYVGAGWSHGNVRAESYGGTYSRTTQQNNTFTWTTPAGTTKVGIDHVSATNAGVSKVEIDGDATLANLCYTASQLVTLGYITAAQRDSIGGGTRCITQYAASTVWSTPVMLAQGLAPGVHTVKLTCLGFKDQRTLSPDSDNIRLYLGGVYHGTAATAISDADATSVAERAFSVANSAYEFAYSYRPTGKSAVFIGNVHGSETQTGVSFLVDGVPTSIAVGGVLTGDDIQIVRVSELTHPDMASVKQADATVTYNLSLQGLRVRHETLWTGTGQVESGYPVMLPFTGAYNRVVIDTMRYPLTMSGPRVQDTPYGGVRASAVFLIDGQYVAGVRLIDGQTTMNNWLRSQSGAAQSNAYALYRADGLNKVYFQRVAANPGNVPEPIVPGSVWKSDALHVGAKLADPEATLLAA